MNIFFKINGVVVTPELNGGILPGVTRQSTIDLCKMWGIPVEEKRISVDEIVEAAKERRDGGVLRHRNRCGGFPGGRASL